MPGGVKGGGFWIIMLIYGAAAPPRMRVFFALEIPRPARDAIADWRDRHAAAGGRAVAAENFHITLHFIGDVEARQLDWLCAEAERIRAMPFELALDQCGWFARPGIFYIGPGDAPAALIDLAAAARKISRIAARKAHAASRQSRKLFTPHVTLFRNCRARPPLPTARPAFNIAFDGFTLFESVAGRDGVRYQPLQRWNAS